MAQRWLQAKEMLAKKNGRVKSGASSALGDVRDDRIMSYGKIKPAPAPMLRPRDVLEQRVVNVSPVKRKMQGTVVVLKAVRPKAWSYTGSDPYTC